MSWPEYSRNPELAEPYKVLEALYNACLERSYPALMSQDNFSAYYSWLVEKNLLLSWWDGPNVHNIFDQIDEYCVSLAYSTFLNEMENGFYKTVYQLENKTMLESAINLLLGEEIIPNASRFGRIFNADWAKQRYRLLNKMTLFKDVCTPIYNQRYKAQTPQEYGHQLSGEALDAYLIDHIQIYPYQQDYFYRSTLKQFHPYYQQYHWHGGFGYTDVNIISLARVNADIYVMSREKSGSSYADLGTGFVKGIKNFIACIPAGSEVEIIRNCIPVNNSIYYETGRWSIELQFISDLAPYLTYYDE